MANQYVQVATDGPGKKVQTFENTISTQVVEAQAVVLVDSAGAEKTTQAITAAALPLPAGASTETTLAAIKAKTDNLDVLLSTRTKPADQQHVIVDSSASVAVTGTVTANAGSGTMAVSAAALPLPSGASTEATLALIKAKTDNLDVLLSTRTKPADTQPVSAAALPLPSGASTAAKQPALGTAGTASADVLTVQGIASMTALKVDGSAVTQPVSGTVAANQGGTWTVQPGNTANTTAWKVDGSAATQPVSAAALPLPAGAATASKQPAIGTAGAASADVLTVQGIASGVAVNAALAAAAASSNSPVGSVSIGTSLGKTLVMKTGTLATSATTADQVILTYTVTSGKIFYLTYLDVNARLTTFAATATSSATPRSRARRARSCSPRWRPALA
jgi:hypothetical protein